MGQKETQRTSESENWSLRHHVGLGHAVCLSLPSHGQTGQGLRLESFFSVHKLQLELDGGHSTLTAI